jgi:phosphohistidine phosphatase
MDRPLTSGGRAAAWRMGACLKASGENPDLALVSPARRTIETLDEVEGALGLRLARVVAAPLYQSSMKTLVALLAETPASDRVVLVIGHNPGLAETANALSKRGSAADLARLRTQFPAPCLAVVAFEATDWRKACRERGRLDRFITPAALQKSEEGA